MRALANWSIKNSVTVNLIMVFIIVAGLLTVMKMRREMFPQFALDMINVSVEYPGSSPEEVEEGICVKIEEQIKGIEGISRTLAGAYEGRGSVTVELDSGADIQQVLDDIKAEVDRIDTFPDEAEEPIVTEIINRNPAITVAIYGNVSEKLLHETAEKIRDDLIDTGPISLAGVAIDYFCYNRFFGFIRKRVDTIHLFWLEPGYSTLTLIISKANCGNISLRIFIRVSSPATIIKTMIRFTVTLFFMDQFAKALIIFHEESNDFLQDKPSARMIYCLSSNGNLTCMPSTASGTGVLMIKSPSANPLFMNTEFLKRRKTLTDLILKRFSSTMYNTSSP